MLVIFSFFSFLSCSEKPTDTAISCEDAAALEWNYWANGFFRTYCLSCHSAQSSERYGAPQGINFDKQEDVEMLADLIYESVIIEERMPEGGGVDPAELQRLEGYLRCWLGAMP